MAENARTNPFDKIIGMGSFSVPRIVVQTVPPFPPPSFCPHQLFATGSAALCRGINHSFPLSLSSALDILNALPHSLTGVRARVSARFLIGTFSLPLSLRACVCVGKEKMLDYEKRHSPLLQRQVIERAKTCHSAHSSRT